jgi:cold shock CspA family protein
VLGTVREWDGELGWGVITGDEMPEPIWVHSEQLPELHVGDRVSFEVEGPVDEAGFRFRAVDVRPA